MMHNQKTIKQDDNFVKGNLERKHITTLFALRKPLLLSGKWSGFTCEQTSNLKRSNDNLGDEVTLW
jgi:hypothetical protein